MLIATQTHPFLIYYGLCLPYPATLNYNMFDPANGMRQDFIDADFDYTELLESVKNSPDFFRDGNAIKKTLRMNILYFCPIELVSKRVGDYFKRVGTGTKTRPEW